MSSTIEFSKICEHCGATFTARKRNTRFCSKRCAEHAYKKAKREEHVAREQSNINQQVNADLKDLEFLSPVQCAKLLGLSVRTFYRYLESNMITCCQFKGKTRIRRSDIEKLFDSTNGYVKRDPHAAEAITEFYTTKEVMEKFGISNAWLFEVAKRESIPKTLHRGKTLWSKKHFDAVFKKKNAALEEITEWYTVEEICKKFDMTITAVYCFASENQIPKRRERRKVFYSKIHVDIAKGVPTTTETEWISLRDAVVHYNTTRDQLYHHAKAAGVAKKKVGKYTYLDKKHLDLVFAPPSI